MKKTFLPGLFLIALALFNCKPEARSGKTPVASPEPVDTLSAAPEETPVQEELPVHNSRISVDWPGTYKGTLPCADCEGMETSLTLFENGDYTRSINYLGGSGQPVTDNGTFTWNESGSEITLSGGEATYQRLQVGENLLFQLDPEGRRIKDPSPDAYTLTKNMNDALLEDRKWILSELRGREVQFAEGGKQAFLTFHSALGQITGNNSCNVLVADYTLAPGNRIAFSRMAGTLKACPGTQIPEQLQEVLETADNYTVRDGVLSLNKARMAPLARFRIQD